MSHHNIQDLATYLETHPENTKTLKGAIKMLQEGIDVRTSQDREAFMDLINRYRHSFYHRVYEMGIKYLQDHPITENGSEACSLEDFEIFLADSNYYNKSVIDQAIDMLKKGICVTNEATANRLLNVVLEYSSEGDIRLFITGIKNLNLCGFWDLERFEMAFYYDNEAILEYLEKNYPQEVQIMKYDQLLDFILEANSYDEIAEYIHKRHLDLGGCNGYIFKKLIEVHDDNTIRLLLSDQFKEYFQTPLNMNALLLCAVNADDPDIVYFLIEECNLNPEIIPESIEYSQIPTHVRKFLRDNGYISPGTHGGSE